MQLLTPLLLRSRSPLFCCAEPALEVFRTPFNAYCAYYRSLGNYSVLGPRWQQEPEKVKEAFRQLAQGGMPGTQQARAEALARLLGVQW